MKEWRARMEHERYERRRGDRQPRAAQQDAMSARDMRLANEAAIASGARYASLARTGVSRVSSLGFAVWRVDARGRWALREVGVILLGASPSSGRSHGVHQQRGGKAWPACRSVIQAAAEARRARSLARGGSGDRSGSAGSALSGRAGRCRCN
jgi:hypothetical protein